MQVVHKRWPLAASTLTYLLWTTAGVLDQEIYVSTLPLYNWVCRKLAKQLVGRGVAWGTLLHWWIYASGLMDHWIIFEATLQDNSQVMSRQLYIYLNHIFVLSQTTSIYLGFYAKFHERLKVFPSWKLVGLYEHPVAYHLWDYCFSAPGKCSWWKLFSRKKSAMLIGKQKPSMSWFGSCF